MSSRKRIRTDEASTSRSQPDAVMDSGSASREEEEKVDFKWTMTPSELSDFINSKFASSIPFIFAGRKGNHDWQIIMEGTTGPDTGNYVFLNMKLLLLDSYGSEDCKLVVSRCQAEIKFPASGLESMSSILNEEPQHVFVDNSVEFSFPGLFTRIVEARNIGFSDAVEICCTLWIEHHDVPVPSTSDVMLGEYRKERQLNSLETLMKSIMNDSFADATLKMGDEVCRVHKCILAGRSKVFAAMFTSDMIEGQSGTIVIEDEPEIVKAMLNYIYCGDISAVKERPCDILKVADKYELLELKDECEKFIIPTLNMENAGQALLCAYEHNLKTAMPEIMKFINRNRAEISRTDMLTEVFRRYPQLSLDLYLSQ